jgi:hypothetical protein
MAAIRPHPTFRRLQVQEVQQRDRHDRGERERVVLLYESSGRAEHPRFSAFAQGEEAAFYGEERYAAHHYQDQ